MISEKKRFERSRKRKRVCVSQRIPPYFSYFVLSHIIFIHIIEIFTLKFVWNLILFNNCKILIIISNHWFNVQEIICFLNHNLINFVGDCDLQLPFDGFPQSIMKMQLQNSKVEIYCKVHSSIWKISNISMDIEIHSIP